MKLPSFVKFFLHFFFFRYVPTLVKQLCSKGITKVTAGSYHSLLLSSQGKVSSLKIQRKIQFL